MIRRKQQNDTSSFRSEAEEGENPPPEASLTSRQRRAFNIAQGAAKQVLRRRFRVVRLARDAYAKMARNENALGQVRDDLWTLGRLAVAWSRREYRNVPWKSVVYAVAALVYFVNPIDLIPDAILGLGFVDDAAVVAAVVRAIQQDLSRFLSWENEHGGTAALDAPAD